MSSAGTSDNGLRPVCFMVMPFNRKHVDGARAGAPGEVDFDLLWHRAFYPAIEKLGYTPVRADADTGSLIIKDMIERLAFADLIIADVSIPNGNVYYEVGVRQVARETGCVLVAADWSRQLFDVDQFRCLRYGLGSSEVTDDEATAIQELFAANVPALRVNKTPYHAIVGGVDLADPDRRGVFRDSAESLSRLQEKAAAIRLMSDDERHTSVRQLVANSDQGLERPDVSLELLRLVRDVLGWRELLQFTETLPEEIRRLPYVREQELLATGEVGEPEEAIAGLLQLIKELGPNPERHGLIGGRYKRLWREARTERIDAGHSQPSSRERRYLGNAIEHYTLGMQQDYNQYYCSANLPALLRSRGSRADRAHADVIERFVIAACERAISLDLADEWVWPTLLGAAFRSGDINKAEDLAARIEMEGVPDWNLKTTLTDLNDIVEQTTDDAMQDELRAICERLSSVLEDGR